MVSIQLSNIDFTFSAAEVFPRGGYSRLQVTGMIKKFYQGKKQIKLLALNFLILGFFSVGKFCQVFLGVA